MINQQEINKKIKHLMVEYNFNQTTLGEAAKIDRTVICAIFSGRRKWTLQQAYKIIKVFPNDLSFKDFGFED